MFDLFIFATSISLGLVFWLLLIIAAVLGVLGWRTDRNYYYLGGNLLIIILIVILGLSEFGFNLTK